MQKGKLQLFIESLKFRFANLKSIALILLAGLIFASGFIAAKTLLFTDALIESSGEPGLKESFSDPGVKASSGEPGVSSGGLILSAGNPNVTVWVNTNSDVYHCPNTRWYGNTKSGQYMTQKEAQSKGYRPAHGSVCG